MLITQTTHGRLTKSKVDRFEVRDRTLTVWDTELPAFGVRVTRFGTKTYFLKYRVGRNGLQRHRTIGRHDVMNIERARIMAREWLLLSRNGTDPCAPDLPDQSDPTLKEFSERYIEEYARPNKKKASVDLDEINLRKYILPTLGQLKIRDITRFDIAKLHSSSANNPARGNQVRAMLSHMMNKAEEWGLRADHTNPVRHVRKHKVKERERHLTNDELKRLVLTLHDYERSNPTTANIVWLLLMTGCRRNEITSLRWDFLDFEGRCLRLPDSKTGKKYVPLANLALEKLRSLPRLGSNPFCFPGRNPDTHVTTIQKSWDTIRRRAGIPELRLHDLRHNYATTAAKQNVSLHKIAGVLGHKQVSTTERYSHHVEPELLKAANLTAEAILSASCRERSD